jgi:hypothetical protein
MNGLRNEVAGQLRGTAVPMLGWRAALAVSTMWYRIGADLVLAAHLLFIGFVVGGAFLAWRWPRIIWVQLPAMAYGALVEFVGFTCPLTSLQNYLLRRAGGSGYRGGFISHYLIQVIYPPGLIWGIQIGLGCSSCSSPPSDTAVTCTGTARSRLGGPVTDHPCPADAPTAA